MSPRSGGGGGGHEEHLIDSRRNRSVVRAIQQRRDRQLPSPYKDRSCPDGLLFGGNIKKRKKSPRRV